MVNAISRLELQGYMANTLLRDTDAMSMAHSLEVRVPFVDVNVVEYVLSLPGDWKLDQARTDVPKPLLADAVADLLPRDFLARRKMGFTLPFEKWMQGRMRTEIASVFEDERQLADAGLVPKGVRAVWQRFLNAPRAVGWSRPWSLFVLANWCRLIASRCDESLARHSVARGTFGWTSGGDRADVSRASDAGSRSADCDDQRGTATGKHGFQYRIMTV